MGELAPESVFFIFLFLVALLRCAGIKYPSRSPEI